MNHFNELFEEKPSKWKTLKHIITFLLYAIALFGLIFLDIIGKDLSNITNIINI